MSSINTIEFSRRIQLPRWKSTCLSVGMLTFVIVLAYSNSLSAPFVFDDTVTIVDRHSIRKLWPIWPALFDAGVTALGRPLLNLSFALNYAYGGLDVTSFHVVNLLIHVCASLALFGIVRRTLERPEVPQRFLENATLIAFFCSLIWSVHPLQTESVTYIVQRTESMVGLFYLLTLYCAIRASSSRRPRLWSAASVISCLLGIVSKEVIVSVPVAVMVYDWAFPVPANPHFIRRRRWLYAALFLTWIPLVPLVAIGRGNSAGFGHQMNSWEYSLTQFWAIVHYLQLSFWPDALVLDYGIYLVRDAARIIPCAIAVMLLAVGTIVSIRYQPWIAFLGFVFFATLSPTSSFIPLVTQTIAEHRMYIPLASVVILVVIGIFLISDRCMNRFRKESRPRGTDWLFPTVLLSLTVICLVSLTLYRNYEYQDPRRLWLSNISRFPSSLRPYVYVASTYIDENDGATALLWVNQALEIDKNLEATGTRSRALDGQLASIYYCRGIAYSKMNEPIQAIENLDQAIKLDPSSTDVHFNRALLLKQMRREDEALDSLNKAINGHPLDVERLYARGQIYIKKSRFREAISDLTTALELAPSDPDLYHVRAFCLSQIGQPDLALADYSMAIQLRPGFAQAIYDRGAIYAFLRKYQQAIDDFTQVIALDPVFADAYASRAECLLRIGRTEAAQRDLSAVESLSIHPDSDSRQRNASDMARD